MMNQIDVHQNPGGTGQHISIKMMREKTARQNELVHIEIFVLFVCLCSRFGLPPSKRFTVLTFTRGFDIGLKSLDLDLDSDLNLTSVFRDAVSIFSPVWTPNATHSYHLSGWGISHLCL